MKLLILTICLVVLAFALVAAVPAVNDESIFGADGAAADDTINPQDPQDLLFKKLLLKKKLLLLG
ncbi:hypothetical protein RP20_CCG002621 [Aedes albopictus]|nr:hypothetical protein RP20_CCG002621 [Aedes albopictus]